MDERTVFLEAIEQPTAERREAFLLQACGADAELRRKVDDLLRAHEDAGSFIEHSPVDAHATRLGMASDETDDQAGQFSQSSSNALPPNINLSFLSPSSTASHLGKLGPYEVLEVMGRGAFGIVLRALDPKLNRVVAIKVLSPELAANVMSVRMFLKEAQAAAAVRHDHIVTIHAVDDSTALPYIVMECIVGQSLQQKIDKQGALPVAEILRIGMQIATGLAAAHQQGLVHRDIKPANILLENGIQRVKITDFGLARAVDDLAHAQTFQVAGTPQYMSPEQANGAAVDQRSDLFSLGSILYTMCTGRPAFRADSIVGILKRVCDETPRPIHELNPDIPHWLVSITTRLMEKNPDDRFQSAEEVAELLRSHLAGAQQKNPVTARSTAPMTEDSPGRSFWRTLSPVGVFAVIASLVLGATLLMGLFIGIALFIPIAFFSLSQVEVTPARIEHDIQFDGRPVSESMSTVPAETPITARVRDSNSPWIDLLKSESLKELCRTVPGASWQDGALILTSTSRMDYCQVWVDDVKLQNARMRVTATLEHVAPFGSLKLSGDHKSGSPRRLDAMLVNQSPGTDLFAIWQYNEAFNITKTHEMPVQVDWTGPITLTCEIRHGEMTAQVADHVIQLAGGLDPKRPFVPLLGTENSTWKILEWQVMELDSESSRSPAGDVPPANGSGKTD